MSNHISATTQQIAKYVIMPGDPLRAKWIAEKFLSDVKLVNEVRNMFAYTGTFNGIEITVMGSGMGNPSMGIYAYELFNEYDVDLILRVGTCGAYQPQVGIKDVIIVNNVASDSSFANQYGFANGYVPYADFELVKKAYEVGSQLSHQPVHVGPVWCSDIFYRVNKEQVTPQIQRMNYLAVEMESFALYSTANWLNKKALTILTVSDSAITKEKTSAAERETTFSDMVKIALALIEQTCAK